jgi:hypothetical protein
VPYVGVEWISNDVLKVEKCAFARLLNIKSVNGSLFHSQGNFPSYGFVEVSQAEAIEMCPADVLARVDFDGVRLWRHLAGVFRRDCSGPELENAGLRSRKAVGAKC